MHAYHSQGSKSLYTACLTAIASIMFSHWNDVNSCYCAERSGMFTWRKFDSFLFLICSEEICEFFIFLHGKLSLVSGAHTFSCCWICNSRGQT